MNWCIMLMNLTSASARLSILSLILKPQTMVNQIKQQYLQCLNSSNKVLNSLGIARFFSSFTIGTMGTRFLNHVHVARYRKFIDASEN